MYALITWKKPCHVRLDYFTLFHRVSSSHVKLLSSCLCLPISYPSFVIPAFEELPFYVGWKPFLFRLSSIHKLNRKQMQSWKQCALPVITTMALRLLMHLGTWCKTTHCWYQWTKECSTSKARGEIYVNISDPWHTECSNLTEAKWL